MSDPTAGVRVELMLSEDTDTVRVVVQPSSSDLLEPPTAPPTAPCAMDVGVPTPVAVVAVTATEPGDLLVTTETLVKEDHDTPLPTTQAVRNDHFQGTATEKNWVRPPLSTCSPEDFMLDFLRHAERRGDDWEGVWDALDNALRRTGKPSDVLGFYKEICQRGGYRHRQSCKGRIKMPFVFMQTHNYYANHTYTDIGNKLLDLYERFFLPYETDHKEDLLVSPCLVCGDRENGSKIPCDGCSSWYHKRCVPAQVVKKTRVEKFTSFLCARCFEGSITSGGVLFKGAKRCFDEIDTMKCDQIDEFFARHVAMRKRRGRAYDEHYVSPIRNPETGNILGKAVAPTPTAQTFPTEPDAPPAGELEQTVVPPQIPVPLVQPSFLVGPAL